MPSRRICLKICAIILILKQYCVSSLDSSLAFHSTFCMWSDNRLSKLVLIDYNLDLMASIESNGSIQASPKAQVRETLCVLLFTRQTSTTDLILFLLESFYYPFKLEQVQFITVFGFAA